MRIGYDAKRLYNNFTGLGNYSRTLLDNLLRNHPEHEYILYTPRMKSGPETSRFLESPGLTTHLPKTLLKSYWRTYSIVSQLKMDKINLYHGLSNELPINIDKYSIKSVVTIHDLIFKIYPGTYPLADRFIYDMKFRYACKHADRIIAVSECTKNDIVRFYHADPEKIEVIYQCINPLFQEQATPEEQQALQEKYKLPADFLLFVGSVTERKNLMNTVKAYEHLPVDLQIPLVIVGRGKKHREEIEREIRRMNKENMFIWFDKLTDNRELRAMYARSKAFVYPSLYEGFGIPVAEALFSKTPVITSLTSALPEAGGPGSLYADPKEPEDIAKAIEKLLTDNDLRQKMIDTGYAYACRNFDSRIISDKVMATYLGI